MKEYWASLYLNANIKNSMVGIEGLFSVEGYKKILVIEDIKLLTGNILQEPNKFIIYLIPSIKNWIEVVGLEEVIYFQNPAISISDTILKMGCDAFFSGYNESITWWYEYYQKGKIIDRFNSNPTEDFLNRYWLDKNDPRSEYLRSVPKYGDHGFPDYVLVKFHGEFSKITPIINNDVETINNKNLKTIRPENAIKKLGNLVKFPNFGQFNSEDLSNFYFEKSESWDSKLKSWHLEGITALIIEY